MSGKSSDLESIIKWAVGELGCKQTHWHLGGKDSAGVAWKEVIVFGGSGGELFINNQVSRKTLTFYTGALKVGAGVGLIPLTVTARNRGMPALGGQIYAKQEMKATDFVGPFTIMQAGGGAGIGGVAAIIFFGHMQTHWSLRDLAEDAVVSAASTFDPLIGMFALCKAFACSLATNSRANVSIAASVGGGYLWM